MAFDCDGKTVINSYLFLDFKNLQPTRRACEISKKSCKDHENIIGSCRVGWKSSNAAFSWLYLSSFPIGPNFVSSPRRSSWPGPGCSKSGGVYRDLHGKSGWNGTLVMVQDFPG